MRMCNKHCVLLSLVYIMSKNPSQGDVTVDKGEDTEHNQLKAELVCETYLMLNDSKSYARVHPSHKDSSSSAVSSYGILYPGAY